MCTNSALTLYKYLEQVISDTYPEFNDVANIIWSVKKGRVELDRVGIEWLWDKNREFVEVKEYTL